MSKHNRDRKQRAADSLPPVNRVPVNLAELGIRAAKGITVGSWCPTPDGSGPAEAVVVAMILETTVGELNVGIRLKSARAVDDLIAALERHRSDVWPGAE